MRNPFKAYWFVCFNVYEFGKVKVVSHRLFTTWIWTKPTDAYRHILSSVANNLNVSELDIVPISFGRN